MDTTALREAADRRDIAARAAVNATSDADARRHSIAAHKAAQDLADHTIAALSKLEDEETRQRRALAQDLAWGTASGPEHRAWLPTLREYRADLNETTDSQGGYLVPAQQAGQFFDLLRSQSVVLKAGPRIMDMGGEVLKVPKILSTTSTGWFAENASISSTEMTFAAVTLTAKKLAAYTELSNEVLSDSTPSVRDVIAFDFMKTMALGLDDAFLEGTGAGAAPTGIRSFTSIGVTYAGADGAYPTLDMILAQIARVEEANGDLSTCAFFMAPRTWGDLMALKDDNGALYFSADTAQYPAKKLFGIPVYTSGQISVTETRGGSGAVCSWIGLCDMQQIAVGRREDMQLKYSSDFKFDTDQTAVRATSRWDIQPINVAACDILAGLTS